MEPKESVMELLEELEEIINDAGTVPFNKGRVAVNAEDIRSIIADIREELPSEMKQAKWVIEERNKILVGAQNEADELLKNTEERAAQMVDDHSVNRMARDQANEIIESAKRTSKELRLNALAYAEEILKEAEEKLSDLKEVVYDESMKTDEYFEKTLGVLRENIGELKVDN